MHKPYIIRQAGSEDIPACAGMLNALFESEQDFTVNREKQIKGLTLLLTSPAARFLVAEDPAGIAGMVTAQLVISTSEGGYAAWVEDLYVAADKRKRGIAHALLTAIEEWGNTKHVTRYQLVADKDNVNALAYYRHLGWQVLNLEVLRRKPGRNI